VEPIGVVALVGEKLFGPGKRGQHQRRALVIAHLPLAEQHDARPAMTVANRVQLGVQAAFRAPNAAGNSPFFKRLAALRCAFKCVASIMIRSGFGPAAARAAKIRSNTPRRLQRMKRLY